MHTVVVLGRLRGVDGQTQTQTGISIEATYRCEELTATRNEVVILMGELSEKDADPCVDNEG